MDAQFMEVQLMGRKIHNTIFVFVFKVKIRLSCVSSSFFFLHMF